jgi:hypothetical protein|nr:hypothetical protein [Candidatus Krumholzibacteria bacterium]
MAQKKSSAKPSYFEVVFKGKPKVVRAFLSGLVMGSGAEGDIYYSYSEGVFHEGKAEKFKELTHFRAIDCHVIMDRETSALVKKMQKSIATETGLEITSHRSIRSASIELSFEAFARRYNDEIVTFLKSLPKGLKLEGFEHDVELHPEAKGVEAYSPSHHYEAKGKGTVTGRVDLVIAFKRELANYPLIKGDEVRLKLA